MLLFQRCDLSRGHLFLSLRGAFIHRISLLRGATTLGAISTYISHTLLGADGRLLTFLSCLVGQCHSLQVLNSLHHAQYVDGAQLAQVVQVIEAKACNQAVLACFCRL